MLSQANNSSQAITNEILLQNEENIMMKIEEFHSIFMNLQSKLGDQEEYLASFHQWNVDKTRIYDKAKKQMKKK
jgi:prephenate dehydrogenase